RSPPSHGGTEETRTTVLRASVSLWLISPPNCVALARWYEARSLELSLPQGWEFDATVVPIASRMTRSFTVMRHRPRAIERRRLGPDRTTTISTIRFHACFRNECG